jgi:uncharacterized protein
MITFRNWAWLALGAQLVLGCGGDANTAGSIASNPDPDAGSCTFANNSMPSPASDHCTRSGYTLEIRSSDAGEYGACVFSDGTECEEWSFFRGECGITRTFCAQQGFTAEVRNGELICVFDDGSSCSEWEYSRGCCGPKN